MGNYQICKEIVEEIRRCLLKNDNISKIMLLEAVIQNQYAGRPGAGLTSAARRDALWVDFLTSKSDFITAKSSTPSIEADYYYNDYPISHKEIGWRGQGALALSWSKNPPGGLLRNRFTAPVAIVMLKRPTPHTKDIEHGYYIVTVEYLQEFIEPNLSSNNKTDNLITPKYVFESLRWARSNGLFISLPYNHDAGRGKFLSDWATDVSAIQVR